MMDSLTERDEREWKANCELERLGVFEDLDFERLYRRGLMVHAHCADLKDLPSFLMNKQRELGLPHEPENMFILTRLGGMLKLAPRSPCIRPGRSTAIDYCEEIEQALEYSGRTRVTGGTHWQCKEARKGDVSVGYSRCLHFMAVSFFNQRRIINSFYKIFKSILP